MKCLISENLRSGKVQNDGTFIGQFSKSRNSANMRLWCMFLEDRIVCSLSRLTFFN